MSKFIRGMELSRQFYSDVVRPLIEQRFHGLEYSAGLMDYGSDVLGFDDDVSTDHQWGPRLSIFLKPDDLSTLGQELDLALSDRLPAAFNGFSTSFSGTRSDPIRCMEPAGDGPIKHIIRIHSAEEFFAQHLGIDIHKPLGTLDWLLFPQQRLTTIRKGQLFHDGLSMHRIKSLLEYYPDEVWRYLMCVEWQKYASEEAFVGRCGHVGDDLGSRLVTARQVNRLMNLHFLQQREYIPYGKWFGTAFSRLAKPVELDASLRNAMTVADWRSREENLAEACSILGSGHNRLGLTAHLETRIQRFHGRPYSVVFAGKFSDALHSTIANPALRTLSRLGGIDQVSDNAAVLTDIDVAKRAIHLYGHEA